jgi:putative Mg2+ transporter-C (MgtC) family protein
VPIGTGHGHNRFYRVETIWFDDRLAGMEFGDAALRLGLALLCGLIVGIDREVRNKPAGMRTHMLVSLAAASFTLISFDFHYRLVAQGNAGGTDPIRALEAVVAGVAFLGAGTIIQSHRKVSGVTTGAGMWMAGAIGLACGGGLFAIAIALTLAMFVVVTLLGFLEAYFERRTRKSPPQEKEKLG